jgi:hypothetical protein
LKTKSFGKIITLINDISLELLQSTDAVVEGFLALLQDIFDDI